MAAYHARRQRVLNRLAHLHPDEYADLMAAERAAEGLDPAPAWKPDTATCGTRSGVNAHRRRNEPICDPCRQAENAYQRDYMRRRRLREDANA